jgi:N-acetylmuramoyl-L-alanine amidase
MIKKRVFLVMSIIIAILIIGFVAYGIFAKPTRKAIEMAPRVEWNQEEIARTLMQSLEKRRGPGEEAESAATIESALEEPILTREEVVDKGILIAIDPGHQAWEVDMSALEPNAPGSSNMKAKCTSGTSGRYSGLAEFQLNMDISLQLRTELEQRGYQVLLVREDNQTAISNAERATMASDAGAHAYIRIHANSDNNSSVQGALALVSSPTNPHVGHLYDESYALAETILNAYCVETGFRNRGILQNDTMTGINWSRVPVMILEMGFMSNEQDDLAMANPEFQSTMVQGIVNGIEQHFGY